MRFPVTARLQELFTKLGDKFQPKIKPYAFSHDNEIRIRLKLKDVSQRVDHFRAAELIQDTPGNERQQYIQVGATAIPNDVVKHAVGDGTDISNLLKFDGYSTRAYMHTASDYDYDRSLTDFVLKKKKFGLRTQWKCIDGGSNQIAQHMEKKLRKGAVELNSTATSIGLSRDGKTMDVVTRTNNRDTTHRFSHVISTIPLPVLRVIDLSRAKLSPMQSNAIRSLNYTSAVKIGMQFKTAWWREEPLESPVLIASYTWTEDAERLAALIENDKAKLVEIVLDELAKIHNVKLRFLNEQLIDTFAQSWTNNMHTMAAASFFGPGKFKNVYRSMTVPAADGLLHFVGEALSTRHVWIDVALDSAWRAVLEILLKERLDDKLIQFSRDWRASDEWKTPALTSASGDSTDVQVWAQYELFLRHIASQRPEFFDL
ncbi:hypothetical protein APHAL10511_005847 [Amanita phalloides]|nr:hypothetical protein APHAL10511_005847 [Amanita phalloides]